jgi:HD-like signal output (HDOD) protein
MHPETRRPFDRASILHAASALGPMATGSKSVGQLISLLCDESTPTEQLVALIERQPLLAGRMLRVANSAYYGHGRAVTTLPRAVSVLGTQAIRAIAITCCFDRVMLRRLENALEGSSTFLRHSIATAIAAQSLAAAASLPYHEEAYVAGMLHNIGVAIQACVDGVGIRKLESARKAGMTAEVRTLESMYCGASHEMCGGLVLEAWQLPATLVSTAAHHHRPSEAPAAQRPLVSLINIAATLAQSSGCEFVLEPCPAACDPEALGWARVDSRVVEEVAATLADRVNTVWEALTLEPP